MNNIEFKSTFDKLDFEIPMKIYDKHNKDIAIINDHLGEEYGYSDLRDAEEYKLTDERNMYRDMLKEQCDKLDKLEKFLGKETEEIKDKSGKYE